MSKEVKTNAMRMLDKHHIRYDMIQYECDEIKYECSLGNMCISNSTIFFPIDGKIRGFAYAKDMFKDFQCGVVDYDSKLIKSGKKFIIVNDENIYALS